jgi:putative transposase
MRNDLYDRTMATGSFYHIYNRGVAKSTIFLDDNDYLHFIETLNFYLDDERLMRLSLARQKEDFQVSMQKVPQKPLTTIHSYCLMPNHFHLLLEEITPGGISTFLRRCLLSYTRYFNTRYGRVGPLFQGVFRFVLIENDPQFLHVTRYIHLNPYVAKIINDPEKYKWSSYQAYKNAKISRLCNPTLALQLAGSPENYRDFLVDFASYARDFDLIKHHAIDESLGV